MRPRYKQTEVGVIPEDWDVKQLGDLISHIHLGGNYPNQLHESSHPLMKMGNVDRGCFDVSRVEYVQSGVVPDELDRLRHGDLLFNTRNTLDLVGKVAVWKDELPTAYYNSNLLRIEFKLDEIGSNAYANYAFNSARCLKHLRAFATGTTSVAAIYTRDLVNLPFSVPPLAEQYAIATALSDVDALISSLDRLTAKKRDMKQVAMQQLLTGKRRLPGFGGKRNKWLFGELFQFLKTGNSPRSDLSVFGDVRYVHYGDIHTYPRAFLDCELASLPLIARDRVSSLPVLEVGDLVMVDASEDYTGIGKCVEVCNVKDGTVVAGLHTILLRGDRERLADGFKGYLQFIPSVKEALIRSATGISVYGVSKSNVKTIEVCLPEVEEQRAIAAVLSDMDAEIAALERRRDKTRMLKQGMMQELLTGRVRLV